MNRYEKAIEWIALNDEPTILDWNEVSHMVSVCLVADVFGFSTDRVAVDVVKFRKAHEVGK